MKLPAVSRRSLLIGGGAGVGLIVAFAAWPREEASPLRAGAKESVFGPYLRIATDGRVTLASPQVETGQGIWTGLAQIAADELGAAWESMGVEPAPSGAAYANLLIAREYGVTTRITAGSSSIRAFEQPLREAAAMARALLCEAAADRWGVNAAECDTDGNFVVHEGKRIAFGEVAAAAAGLRPPEMAVLRPAGSGKLAGEPLPRLDLPAKSDGSLRFASDLRLPRMIFASIRLAPPGGRLIGYSSEAAKRQEGLVDLVVRDQWLAALGTTWWAADQALARAAPRFSGAETPDLAAALADLLETGEARRIFEQGDYGEATRDATPLAATYSIATAPHHSLEAPAAVARFSDGRLEVWAGTRIPGLARTAAATAAGLEEIDVTLYPMPIGDGSGSGFDLEAIRIAVELARHTGRPVSLALPPATAQNQDAARPPMLARMSALPSPDGGLRSWSARIVGMAGIEQSLAEAGERPSFAARGAEPPYAIGAIRIDAIDAIDAGLPIATGYMRGGEQAMLTFATESFVDEMARALNAEPLAFRVGLLGGSPRLAQAIMTAAKIGGWDGGGRGSNLGLACASVFGSHIGLMAEAAIGPDQRVKVSRLVAAVDAGRIVNPGLVRQQIEGGLLAALALALVPAPEYIAGMPRAVPMRRGYERLGDVPKIEVELISSEQPPGGVSGLGMAVLAPAVANAIAAGTGRRLRILPFDPMSAE